MVQQVVAAVLDTPVELTLGGVGDLQWWDPTLCIPYWAYLQLGMDQQEVILVYGHLRGGCFNSSVYSRSAVSMQGHLVPIGGSQTKHLSLSPTRV